MSSLVPADRSATTTMLLLNDPLLDAGVKVTDVGAAYAAGAASRKASVAPRALRGIDGIHGDHLRTQPRKASASRTVPVGSCDGQHSPVHPRSPSHVTRRGRSPRGARAPCAAPRRPRRAASPPP